MKMFTRLVMLVAFMGTAVAHAQYCLLPGRTIYSNDQPGITNFKLRNINRTSSHVEKPLNQPSLVVTTDSTKLERGKTYSISIMHTKDAVIFPNARNNIRVWIDYNNDKDFLDAGETVITKDYDTAGVHTDSFTVPLTAPLGTTRLRATAKMSSDAGHTIPTPCDESPKDPLDYHGEMEDYTVTIVAVGTSIDDLGNNKNNISVYPNPTTGEVAVSFTAIDPGKVSIELYDVAGKLVANMLNSEKQNSLSYHFNLNDYKVTEGVYFIKISSDNALSYQRVVKVN